MAQQFSAKNPAATRVATFSAVSNLDTGETLTAINSTTVVTLSGNDPNPLSIISTSNPPAINALSVSVDTAAGEITIPAGECVQMGITGGLDKCKYLITVVCATSNPEKILTLTAVLPVSVYA